MLHDLCVFAALGVFARNGPYIRVFRAKAPRSAKKQSLKRDPDGATSS